MAPRKTQEEEWYEEFGYLPQDEQEEMFARWGSPRSTPSARPRAARTSTAWVSPTATPSGGAAALPEYTSKGALDPFDLTQQAKRVNLGQDYGALMLDNILSGMAGPGAYDIGAFTPEMEYGKEVTRPGAERLASYARRGGWEGYLADEIRNGATPTEALSSLQNFVESTPEEDPDRTPEDDAKVKSILDSLSGMKPTGMTPSERKDAGFWGNYDYKSLLDTASEYSDAVFNDPGYGYEEVGPDGRTRYFDRPPEEVKTDQMEFFEKYGLPYPTASYEDPKYLQAMLDAEEGTTPEYREAEAGQYLGGYEDVVGKTKTAEQAMIDAREHDDAMIRAWETTQKRNQPPPPITSKPLTTTIPGRAAVPGQPATGPTTPGTDMFAQMMAEGGGPTAMGAPTQPGRPAVPGTPAVGPRDITIPGVNIPQNLPAPARPQTGPRTAADGRIILTNTEAMNGRRRGDWVNPPSDEYLVVPDDQAAQQAQAPARSMLGQTPTIRTLPSGEVGLAPRRGGFSSTGFGGNEPAFGELDMWQALGGNTRGIFDLTDKKAMDRKMTAKDVDRSAITRRATKANDAAVAARQAQRETEAADPRLNDLRNFAYLRALGQQGRTPLNDAIATRRLGARALGL